MAAPNSTEYALLTEHFSYPPVSLLDDIINTVNVLSDRALNSVERLLLSIPPQNLGFSSKKRDADSSSSSVKELAKLEIENGTHQLETLLNTSIDKNFDIFELYTMRNILTVKEQEQPFMRLAHYEGLDFDNTNSADRPTIESINQLRRRLQASQLVHASLEAERARNDALLRKLRAMVGIKSNDPPVKKEEASGEGAEQRNTLGFLLDTGRLAQGGSEAPITMTTEFTLSQLQSLRTLSTSLRAMIPNLSNSLADESSVDSTRKTWRSERANYIESASRRYLEKSAGLELGPRGELRDGELQGSGRALSKDEVDGLEQVVAILGSAQSSSQDNDEEEEEVEMSNS